MRLPHRLFKILLLLFTGVTVTFLLTGCPGGSFLRTVDPRENGDFSSLSGSLYSLSMTNTGNTDHVVYDHPNGAEVKLIHIDANTGVDLAEQYVAASNVAGGFQFVRIPRGFYRLTAWAVSGETRDIISGDISRIEVKGGIPSLMNNVLLGDPTKQLNFTGIITESGKIAANAIVSLSVQALPRGETNIDNEIAVIMITHTDSAGRYHFRVPNFASSYWLTAHSDTSQLSDEVEIRNVTGDTYTKNIDLIPATNPVLPTLGIDFFSSTLPAATAAASTTALISRVAIAQLHRAPEKLLQRLTQRSAITRASSTAATGSIENDVWCFWDVLNPDEFVYYVRGYHFYRGTDPKGTLTKIGSVYDPFQTVFIDNDPALTALTDYYYTARAYAANNKLSDPAPAVLVKPLPAISAFTSSNVIIDGRPNARLTWNAVPGAQSYTLLVYDAIPTFNTAPRSELSRQLTGTETSALISAAGTYYCSINAYNNRDTNLATAAAFSDFQRIEVPFSP